MPIQFAETAAICDEIAAVCSGRLPAPVRLEDPRGWLESSDVLDSRGPAELRPLLACTM